MSLSPVGPTVSVHPSSSVCFSVEVSSPLLVACALPRSLLGTGASHRHRGRLLQLREDPAGRHAPPLHLALQQHVVPHAHGGVGRLDPQHGHSCASERGGASEPGPRALLPPPPSSVSPASCPSPRASRCPVASTQPWPRPRPSRPCGPYRSWRWTGWPGAPAGDTAAPAPARGPAPPPPSAAASAGHRSSSGGSPTAL